MLDTDLVANVVVGIAIYKVTIGLIIFILERILMMSMKKEARELCKLKAKKMARESFKRKLREALSKEYEDLENEEQINVN